MADITFDDNGFAQADGFMEIYCFDPNTKIYTGSYNAQMTVGFSVPASSTSFPPPQVGNGQVAVFDDDPVYKNKKWVIMESHIGEEAWEKSTGRMVIVSMPGPISDTLTTVKPDFPYVTWDNSTQKWDIDTTKRQKFFQDHAKEALKSIQQQASMIVAMGQTFGPKTRDYVKAITDIANGTNTSATEMPTAPDDATT